MTKVYCMNAFASSEKEGNLAAVILLDALDDMDQERMQQIARDLAYSETAFLVQKESNLLEARYFTPSQEIDMCGHASVAAFALLSLLKKGTKGEYVLQTRKEKWKVRLEDGKVWIDFGQASIEPVLQEKDMEEICSSFALKLDDLHPTLLIRPALAGVKDLQMFVKSHDALMKARLQKEQVDKLSQKHDVVGIHMSYWDERNKVVYCSNYAPRYGIDEECATGTSNAGMSGILLQEGRLKVLDQLEIIQGEHMGRIGRLASQIRKDESDHLHVWIGGEAFLVEEKEI